MKPDVSVGTTMFELPGAQNAAVAQEGNLPPVPDATEIKNDVDRDRIADSCSESDAPDLAARPGDGQSLLTLAEARQEVRFCNSYSRLPTVLGLHQHLAEADFLTLLGQEWTGCDNFCQYASLLATLLPHYNTPEMMMADERSALASLPARVEVHRGADFNVNEEGYSWSLDPHIAITFAGQLNRYPAKNPVLISGWVERDHIVALKLGRDEQEVVVRPEHVVDRRRENIHRGAAMLSPGASVGSPADALDEPDEYMTLESVRQFLVTEDNTAEGYDRLESILYAGYHLRTSDLGRLLGEEWLSFHTFAVYEEALLELLPYETCPTMMDPHERAALRKMPARLQVFRGADRGVTEWGFSWYARRELAARFPFMERSLAQNPILVSGWIERNRIIAVKGRGDEQTLVIRPEHLTKTRRQRLDRAKVLAAIRSKV